MSCTIETMMAPASKYPIKCPYIIKPNWVVIHNTANDASARNEVSYMLKNNYEISFHYAVDDVRAVQGLPLNRNGWHAGDGKNLNGGNMKGIAIEICYSKSGRDKFSKAEQNGAWLAAKLLHTYGWTVSHLKKHQDFSNKKCPHRTIDEGWQRFVNMVQKELDKLNGSNSKPNIVESVNIDIYYRVKTQKHGWLAEVKNALDYAGWQGSSITAIAMRVSKGKLEYQVHRLGKPKNEWFEKVTGYNINDHKNGYAGDGKNPIDCLKAYYYTPDDVRPYQEVLYKVNTYSYQHDTSTKNGQDGYAGMYGKPITQLWMKVQ